MRFFATGSNPSGAGGKVAALHGLGIEQSCSLTANYAGDVDNTPSGSSVIVVTVLNASDVVFLNAFEMDLPSGTIE